MCVHVCVCKYVCVWFSVTLFGDARCWMKASMSPSPFPMPMHLYLKSWFLFLEGVATLSEGGQPSRVQTEDLTAVATIRTNKKMNKSTHSYNRLPCILGVTASMWWTGSDPLEGHLSYRKEPHSFITPSTKSNWTPPYTGQNTPFPHPRYPEAPSFPKSLFCTIHLYYIYHLVHLHN